MKIYSVNRTTGANQLNLETTGKVSFETQSFEEAKAAFDAEVAACRKTLKTIDQLDYTPSESETLNDAVVVNLCVIDEEAEDMADEIDVLESSDYFFGIGL